MRKPLVYNCILIFTLKTVYLKSHWNGECSSVGRAPDCGSGGRGFESLHSPQKFYPMVNYKKIFIDVKNNKKNLASGTKKLYITLHTHFKF